MLCEPPTPSCHRGEMDKVAEGSKPRKQKSKKSRTFQGTEVWETTWLLEILVVHYCGNIAQVERWAGHR